MQRKPSVPMSMPALLVLLLASATALGAPPHVARLVGNFHETEAVDVNVSGSVIVGVASANAVGGKAVQSLQLLHAPSPDKRQVCLTLQSRDGVYYSRNTFELPADSAGSVVRIPYDKSSRLDRLARYGRDELAMRATAGSCETSTSQYYVLDASAARPPESIRVFVNSFGATDVFHSSGRGKSSPCTPVGEGRRTAFDYWCEIPWPRGGSDKLAVEIQRERFGRDMPPVSLTLFLKSGS
jgi:hypothetical protein